MASLLDPKYEEEIEPEEQWYAVIIYDDASGIWHLTAHPTEEEAMDTLRQLVFDTIGGNEDNDDGYWSDIRESYMRWTLADMNEQLEGENGINTVFCKKGGTE